jgi:hypothetical protein
VDGKRHSTLGADGLAIGLLRASHGSSPLPVHGGIVQPEACSPASVASSRSSSPGPAAESRSTAGAAADVCAQIHTAIPIGLSPVTAARMTRSLGSGRTFDSADRIASAP